MRLGVSEAVGDAEGLPVGLAVPVAVGVGVLVAVLVDVICKETPSSYSCCGSRATAASATPPCPGGICANKKATRGMVTATRPKLKRTRRLTFISVNFDCNVSPARAEANQASDAKIPGCRHSARKDYKECVDRLQITCISLYTIKAKRSRQQENFCYRLRQSYQLWPSRPGRLGPAASAP